MAAPAAPADAGMVGDELALLLPQLGHLLLAGDLDAEHLLPGVARDDLDVQRVQIYPLEKPR